jgi:hypothetical protein
LSPSLPGLQPGPSRRPVRIGALACEVESFGARSGLSYAEGLQDSGVSVFFSANVLVLLSSHDERFSSVTFSLMIHYLSCKKESRIFGVAPVSEVDLGLNLDIA